MTSGCPWAGSPMAPGPTAPSLKARLCEAALLVCEQTEPGSSRHSSSAVSSLSSRRLPHPASLDLSGVTLPSAVLGHCCAVAATALARVTHSHRSLYNAPPRACCMIAAPSAPLHCHCFTIECLNTSLQILCICAEPLDSHLCDRILWSWRWWLVVSPAMQFHVVCP